MKKLIVNTYKYKEDIFTNFNKYLQEISPKTLLIKLENDTLSAELI